MNAYGRSKRAAEAVVQERSRTAWTILRPGAVYGPRDRGFLPLFRLARRGWFFRPTPRDVSFTLVDVADLSRAVLIAASSDRAVGETLFIGHREPQSTDAIVQALAAAFERRRPAAIGLPRPIVRMAAAIGDLSWRWGWSFAFDSGRLAEFDAEGFVCSTDRASSVMGFTADTSISEGFVRTAKWYRQNRWL